MQIVCLLKSNYSVKNLGLPINKFACIFVCLPEALARFMAQYILFVPIPVKVVEFMLIAILAPPEL